MAVRNPETSAHYSQQFTSFDKQSKLGHKQNGAHFYVPLFFINVINVLNVPNVENECGNVKMGECEIHHLPHLSHSPHSPHSFPTLGTFNTFITFMNLRAVSSRIDDTEAATHGELFVNALQRPLDQLLIHHPHLIDSILLYRCKRQYDALAHLYR